MGGAAAPAQGRHGWRCEVIYRDKRVLFFDTSALESVENVTLTMNPPQKRGPCVFLEKEWEAETFRPFSIIRWQGLYRLYCRVRVGGAGALSFLTSEDGINWSRPDLGVVEFGGSTANNLVDMQGASPDETCVFVDPTAPVEHRFKMILHRPFEGMFLMTSPDGLRFRRVPGLLLHHHTDNHMSAFWDEEAGRYRIYLRGGDRANPVPPTKGARMVVLAETDDLFKPLATINDAPDPWDYGIERPGPDGKPVRPLPPINRELPKALAMDEFDPPQADLYQAAAVHYCPGVYFAFPTLYYHYPAPPEGFINDGTLDLQFAASRGGVLWQRDFRGSYVRLDLPGGPCTKQMHMLHGIVPGEQTLQQYHVGSDRTHGQGRTPENPKPHFPLVPGQPIAFRVEQRMDGFVSADSDYRGGRLLTAPFEIRSDRLRLNIDTSASGDARAALVDDGGWEIPGFGLEDSDRIQGNDTRYTVTWKGREDVSALIGRQVRLLLRSRSARLFAVYPEDPQPSGDTF